MTKNPLVWIALGLGGVLLWSQLGKDAAPAPAPQPNEADQAAALRANVASLLAQAAASPLSVNPDAMAQLAVDLDAAGLSNEAAQVRQAEAAVRAAQSAARPNPPITGPVRGPNGEVITPPPANQPSGAGTPGKLANADAAEVQALLNQANPDLATLLRVAARIDALQPGGGAFPSIVQALRDKANRVAAAQGISPRRFHFNRPLGG